MSDDANPVVEWKRGAAYQNSQLGQPTTQKQRDAGGCPECRGYFVHDQGCPDEYVRPPT